MQIVGGSIPLASASKEEYGQSNDDDRATMV